MLARKYRITQSEFKRFIRKSRVRKNDIFFIKYCPNHKNYSQFSIVVSLKVSKLATKRNRFKRLISSWIQEDINILPKGLYIVIYLNKPINKTDKKTKKDILIRLLSSLKCLY